jgi:hypothetical protein
MKRIYLSLLLAFTFVLSGQELVNVNLTTNENLPNFKLYPNPAYEDVVYINTNDNALKMVIVYDVFGKIVLRDRISTDALNISTLIPGVYLLQVTEHQKTMTRKLVVK